jgi:ABC-type polysaccharide/polyol phosphate transport system ATPase subunit
MKAAVAIEVENISKSYIIKDDSGNEKEFYALDNVSFSLNKGDVLAIIGSNGSGKSTLLKILSQITKPSQGKVKLYGLATSILEIGTNFHQELSGRENVAIHLKLWKVPTDKIKDFHKEILEFSEVGYFYDAPVKLYSNGMFLRLAFSLAFHLPSEILILDEVFAVGDEGFRLKSQDFLKRFTENNHTIILVSHNRNEVLDYCNKCLWLDKGLVRKIGKPSEVLGEYFSMHKDNYDQKKQIVELDENLYLNNQKQNGTIDLKWSDSNATGNEHISLLALSVLPIENKERIINSEPFILECLLKKNGIGFNIGVFFFIQDVFYQPVMYSHSFKGTESEEERDKYKIENGLIRFKCIVPGNLLIPGKYFLLFRFGVEAKEWSQNSPEGLRMSEKLQFEIFPDSNYTDFIGDLGKGSIRPAMEWTVDKE